MISAVIVASISIISFVVVIIIIIATSR